MLNLSGISKAGTKPKAGIRMFGYVHLIWTGCGSRWPKTNHIQFENFKCLILLKSPNGACLSRKWHEHCYAELQVEKSALLSFLF